MYVQRDVLPRILRLQVQQLRHDQVRDLGVHQRPHEHDALAQQARVDVQGALAAGSLLDHHRDDWAHAPNIAGFQARRRRGGHSWLLAPRGFAVTQPLRFVAMAVGALLAERHRALA
jgi:hypothetical protein